jgi:hypothetical protein
MYNNGHGSGSGHNSMYNNGHGSGSGHDSMHHDQHHSNDHSSMYPSKNEGEKLEKRLQINKNNLKCMTKPPANQRPQVKKPGGDYCVTAVQPHCIMLNSTNDIVIENVRLLDPNIKKLTFKVSKGPYFMDRVGKKKVDKKLCETSGKYALTNHCCDTELGNGADPLTDKGHYRIFLDENLIHYNSKPPNGKPPQIEIGYDCRNNTNSISEWRCAYARNDANNITGGQEKPFRHFSRQIEHFAVVECAALPTFNWVHIFDQDGKKVEDCLAWTDGVKNQGPRMGFCCGTEETDKLCSDQRYPGTPNPPPQKIDMRCSAEDNYHVRRRRLLKNSRASC